MSGETISRYDRAMALARRMARERDERRAQLRTSEREADRYRRALRDIAALPHERLLHDARRIAVKALEQPTNAERTTA